MTDPCQRAVFFDVHRDLPREAPGSRESTERALRLIERVPSRARVLDVGCGPGMQTLDLAELLADATLTAVDAHPGFLRELRRRALTRGFGDRVSAVRGDMRALPFESASFDVIWCEGAAYIMGFAHAIRAWKGLLARGGSMAITELVWLRPDAPESTRRFWTEGYPAMSDVPGCRHAIAAAGLERVGDFVLPESAWWDDYYGPMQRRLAELAPRYAGDAVAEHVLAACADEIERYRRHGSYYGYAFFVMRR